MRSWSGLKKQEQNLLKSLLVSFQAQQNYEQHSKKYELVSVEITSYLCIKYYCSFITALT